jgi:hypothetical protein
MHSESFGQCAQQEMEGSLKAFQNMSVGVNGSNDANYHENDPTVRDGRPSPDPGDHQHGQRHVIILPLQRVDRPQANPSAVTFPTQSADRQGQLSAPTDHRHRSKPATITSSIESNTRQGLELGVITTSIESHVHQQEGLGVATGDQQSAEPSATSSVESNSRQGLELGVISTSIESDPHQQDEPDVGTGFQQSVESSAITSSVESNSRQGLELGVITTSIESNVHQHDEPDVGTGDQQLVESSASTSFGESNDLHGSAFNGIIAPIESNARQQGKPDVQTSDQQSVEGGDLSQGTPSAMALRVHFGDQPARAEVFPHVTESSLTTFPLQTSEQHQVESAVTTLPLDCDAQVNPPLGLNSGAGLAHSSKADSLPTDKSQGTELLNEPVPVIAPLQCETMKGSNDNETTSSIPSREWPNNAAILQGSSEFTTVENTIPSNPLYSNTIPSSRSPIGDF